MAEAFFSVSPPMGWEVFPDLPGLKFPARVETIWDDRETVSASGRSYLSSYWTYPMYRFTLTYEVLREWSGLDERQQLAGFFNGRFGRLKPFLFRDPSGHSVTDLQFGLGDGVRTDFALTRLIGGIAEPVGGAIIQNIKSAGVATSAYTLLDSRIVRFSVAPPVGAILTWTGLYWLRCRFADKSLSLDEILRKLWQGGVKIQTVKL